MQTLTLQNRLGLPITTSLLTPSNPPRGLAILLHGLGGFRTQKHMQTIAETFLSNDYAVLNIDATNSIGDGGGRYEDATMQKHYEDLEDVIAWAKHQPWFIAPFILTGHSLGGYAVARYAEEHPEEVRALFPFANVVSGELSFEANERFKPGKLAAWKETGWFIRTSKSRPDIEMRLPWSHMEERLNHDLRPHADKLTMPVLMIVGSEDDSTPPDHQRGFFDMLPDQSIPRKEIHIIPGAPHTFKAPEHLAELAKTLDAWVKKIL